MEWCTTRDGGESRTARAGGGRLRIRCERRAPGIAAMSAEKPLDPAGEPRDIAAAMLLDYAHDELCVAIACLGWRGARLHGGVHQARKSIRRVRATLALGAPALGAGARLLDRELRRVNDRLSTLRDAHALVVALTALVQDTVDPRDRALLRRVQRAAAAHRAEHTREQLMAEPALDDTRALLRVLLAALPALAWSALAGIDVAIEASRADVASAGARAASTGTDENWHRWRRRARRLSQQQRALGSGEGRDAAERRARKIAIALGKAQDFSLIAEYCGKRSPFAREDRRRLRSIARTRLETLRKEIAGAAVRRAVVALEDAKD